MAENEQAPTVTPPDLTATKKLWERLYTAADRGRGITLSREEVRIIERWAKGAY